MMIYSLIACGCSFAAGVALTHCLCMCGSNVALRREKQRNKRLRAIILELSGKDYQEGGRSDSVVSIKRAGVGQGIETLGESLPEGLH